MFLKNKIFYLINNFFFITTFIYLIFFLFNKRYYFEWDLVYIYLVSLKPLINQKLYLDYSFFHAPFWNIIFEFLNLLKINSFNFLLLTGFFQSLFAGYLSVLLCRHTIKSKYFEKIFYLITIFSFSNAYYSLFWDSFAPLLGIYGLYLIFIKQNILGIFFLSLIFFVKQTFGITFFFIFFFLSITHYIYFKKKIYFYNIILLFFINLLYLILIYFFYDIKQFYFENIHIIFNITDYENRNISLDYFLSIFFIFPDINNFSALKQSLFEKKSFAQLLFYLLFRLPVFCLNIYLLFNIKNFYKKNYQILLIFILSIILPLPLLGRGYWGTIYFFPVLSLYFIILIKKKFSFFLIKKNFYIYIYIFIIFSFLLLNEFKRLNFDFNLERNVIRSKENFFLNINKSRLDNISLDSVKNIYDYLYVNKLNNIFIVDHSSSIVMTLLSQAPLNRDLGILDRHFWLEQYTQNTQINNLDRFVNDFQSKSPSYILYNIDKYQKIKNFIPLNLFERYELDYYNSDFVLLKKLL